MHEYAAAAELLKEFEAQAGRADAQASLAQALISKNDFPQARRVLALCLRGNPGYPEAVALQASLDRL